MRPEALLAIRSDIANSVEPEYLSWLTKEHTLERVSIKGFLSARILRSRHPGFGRYLILYELADQSVVDSPAYLERLNNPSPWTTRIMPHLGNFVRGGGAITAACGAGHGTVVLPVVKRERVRADVREALEALSKVPAVVSARLLEADADRTRAATEERKLRSGDQTFQSLLMIETLDEFALQQVVRELPDEIAAQIKCLDEHEVSGYFQIFSLNSSNLTLRERT